MRHGRTIFAAAGALMLTAPATAQAPPTLPNPFNERLQRLSPTDRYGALRRAVTLADAACGRLDGAVYRGPWGNLRFWQVHCAPGGDYSVFVGPAGEVQVRTCAEIRGQKVPQCMARPTR